MQKNRIEKYDTVSIQCHNNPDADTIASGFGLYCYLQSKGKKVTLFYSGPLQIQKSNLKLMIEKLAIPIEYKPASSGKIEGLLITVDCQYGAGNVTRFEADEVAVFDHHQIEMENMPFAVMNSTLGSCSTLVWKYLKEQGFSVNDNENLATALYYGLYSDTNQFAEMYNPIDLDMRDELSVNQSLITLFRNSNITLEELNIAGIAMLRCNYNEAYHFAIVKAQPCDPNILGLISDFLIQVEGVLTCVVYNTQPEGYKLSVRSCTREVKASELVQYLTDKMGSGGGHFEKAGGFISQSLYQSRFKKCPSEDYFAKRMEDYFKEFALIELYKDKKVLANMMKYRRQRKHFGCVLTTDIGKKNELLFIRTSAGDQEITVEENQYLLFDFQGTIRLLSREYFDAHYSITDKEVQMELDYLPKVRTSEKKLFSLTGAKDCKEKETKELYAKELTHAVKLFVKENARTYLTGQPGDYLVMEDAEPEKAEIVRKSEFLSAFQRAEK